MRGIAPQTTLRAQGEETAQALPALIAQAQALASAVVPGIHGRRRAGPGSLFWQYRRAEPHETQRIDWRRSGRSDQVYVQDREWQTAQSVGLWVDPAARLDFGEGASHKASRARLMAMALAIGLLRGGERVGLPGRLRCASGPQQRDRIASGLLAGADGTPDIEALPLGAQLILISDFLGPVGDLEPVLRRATARRITPVLMQVLHPQELEFPFAGRVVFQDMDGQPKHDTNSAAGLRTAYQARLADHQHALRRTAARFGARVVLHRTDQAATRGLLALWQVLAEGAR